MNRLKYSMGIRKSNTNVLDQLYYNNIMLSDDKPERVLRNRGLQRREPKDYSQSVLDDYQYVRFKILYL